MTDSEYIAQLELDEVERLEKIKKAISKNNLDYLYTEFDFAENEIITDAFVGDDNRVHIFYFESEDYITCPDGIVRTEEEYEDWIHSLMELYETEPNDLDSNELKALVDACFITDEVLDEDTVECEDGYTRAQEEYDQYIEELRNRDFDDLTDEEQAELEKSTLYRL